MKKTFTALPKPIVACIFAPPSVEEAMATMRNGEFAGSDAFAIHLRMDKALLTRENFARIARSTAKPVMFLLYRGDAAGWPAPASDEERVELLKMAIRAGGAAVDFPADTFDPSPREISWNPEVIDRQRRAIDEVHEMGGEVVVSSHIAEPLSTGEVLEHMLSIEKRGADFAKIVTTADTEEQYVEAVNTTLALRRELHVPFIHLISGKFALAHRFLAPKLGCAVTFCVERYSANFVTSQPPVQNMKSVLRDFCWNIADTDETEGEAK